MSDNTAYLLRNRMNKITQNKLFELMVIFVILSSALIIGVRSFTIPTWLQHSLNLVDTGITLFFVVEIVIRFVGYENKKRFFYNGWNLFDSIVVAMSLIPADNNQLVLLARLIRVFRVLRMISLIPELRVLVNSLLKTLPQLGYVILMMFVIFYIYAAVGTTLFASVNKELWGDILVSLLTLFRVMTFEDWTDVMYETMTVHSWSWIYYLTFIFLTAFAFLNMVIGVVVNVMEKESRRVEHENEEEEPTLTDIYQELTRLRAELESVKKKHN